jgi:hypothetical protein
VKRAKKIPSLPDQKLGAAAIGQTVLRDFGVDGIVSGTVSAFRKEGVDEIYAIQYEDGDVEEIGPAEYTVGYEQWLRQTGWAPDDVTLTTDTKTPARKRKTTLSKKAIERLAEVIDLTAASTIAGKHLKSMSASSKRAVIETAEKAHKKLENKNVKAAVLEVQYAALCEAAFVEHLKRKVTPAKQMQHYRRQTLMEEQALLAKLKKGDWIFASDDMSPGMNSEGGYGCIVSLTYKEQCVAYEDGDVEPILQSVDVHWLICNRLERHVKLERLTVVSISSPCIVVPYLYVMKFMPYVCPGTHALQGRAAHLTS